MPIPLHPLASLKTALAARLRADTDLRALIGDAVHETLPIEARAPFVTFGDARLRETGGVNAPQTEIELELIAMTRERATLDILDLASGVEKALGEPLPLLPGHVLVLLELRDTRTRHDPERAAGRASIRLKAIVEPA